MNTNKHLSNLKTLLFCIMFPALVFAQAITPTLYIPVETTNTLRNYSIKHLEATSLFVDFQFSENGSRMDLSSADTVTFRFVPDDEAWTSTINGSLVNTGTNGVAQVAFTPGNSNTNGAFNFVMLVSVGGTEVLGRAEGELQLDKNWGHTVTNAFPAATNVGAIAYWSGSGYSLLVPGISGQRLTTLGDGSAPKWSSGGANVLAGGTNIVITTNGNIRTISTDGNLQGQITAVKATADAALPEADVDADIKTFALPANTTISAFGKTLVDDADAGTARSTLNVDIAGTDNSTNVTVTDSSEIDFTITGQDLTGELKSASIDESKLDVSVNASLDLADSALQDNDTGVTLSGTFSGTLSGDGSGVTNINGSSIASGTVADARIASTIARDSEVLAVSNAVTATSMQKAGDTATGSLLTTVDHSTIAPSAQEFPTADWVRSLSIGGSAWYLTQNAYTGTWTKATVVNLSTTVPADLFTNTIASPITSDTYFAGGITTQLFGALRSPLSFEIYMNRLGGNQSTVIPIHPEVYYVYEGTTNHLGDWEVDSQNIDATDPTKYTFTVAFQEPVLTGSVYIVNYLKSETVSGSAAGLQVYGGNGRPSHFNISATDAGESFADALHIDGGNEPTADIGWGGYNLDNCGTGTFDVVALDTNLFLAQVPDLGIVEGKGGLGILLLSASRWSENDKGGAGFWLGDVSLDGANIAWTGTNANSRFEWRSKGFQFTTPIMTLDEDALQVAVNQTNSASIDLTDHPLTNAILDGSDITVGTVAESVIASTMATDAEVASADTVVSNGLTVACDAADVVISNAVTSAFTSADTVVSNAVVASSFQKTGGTLSGNILIPTNWIVFDMNYGFEWRQDASNSVKLYGTSPTSAVLRFTVDNVESNTLWNL